MKKKMLILFITCFICLFVFTSNIGAWGYGTVYVVVRDRYYNYVDTWTYVYLDNREFYSLGNGFYRATTSLGWHCVNVAGKPYWVDVKPDHNWVNAFI